MTVNMMQNSKILKVKNVNSLLSMLFNVISGNNDKTESEKANE